MKFSRGLQSIGLLATLAAAITIVAAPASGTTEAPATDTVETVVDGSNVSAETTCPSGTAAVINRSYLVNGTDTISDLTGNVDPGDHVQANFSIAAGCEDVTVSLAAYFAPSGTFNAATLAQQQLADSDTGSFDAGGPYALDVDIPECFYQIDFVRGEVINTFTPPSGTYSAQGRLIDADNGGTTGCQAPAASAQADCDTGGALVSLVNSGPQAVTFQVGLAPDALSPHSVGPEGKVFTLPVAEGGNVTVYIQAPGMTDKAIPVNMDCQNPLASQAAMDCDEGGATVLLSNLGAESPVTFTVSKPATTGSPAYSADVTLQPGDEDIAHTVPMIEGETAIISVNAPNMPAVDKSVTYDCQKPSASIADVECGDNGIDVLLSNTGELAVTFTVSKPGYSANVPVAAGAVNVPHTVPMAEDETALITVAAPGMTDVTRTQTYNCVEPAVITRTSTNPTPAATQTVAGVQQARGAALAATGAPSSMLRLVVFGLLLMMAGAYLTRRAASQP